MRSGSYKAGIGELRTEMLKRGLDAALVFTSDEHGSEYIDRHYAFREYLTGFTGSAGSLLVTADEAGLWTDGRYFIQAESELAGSGIALHRLGEKGVRDIFEYTADIAKRFHDRNARLNIGIDLKLITGKAYNRIKQLCDIYGSVVTDVDLAEAVWKDRPAVTHERLEVLSDAVTGRAVKDKLEGIRNKLAEYDTQAVIISDLSDVMWTFNIRGNDISYNPVAVSYGIVDMDTAVLFADRDSVNDELIRIMKKNGVSVRDYASFDGYIQDLKYAKVLCDLKTLNAHVSNLFNGSVTVDKPSWEYIPKYIKNEAEIRRAQEAHVEDGLAVIRFIYKIKKLVKDKLNSSGEINEYDAARMLDDIRRSADGNRGLSFETISAYAQNGAVIHYSPDSTGSAVLKPEGLLLVDSGGQYEGATTDVTRTIALGALTDEMKTDYTTVLKGMTDLADAVFLEGTRGENLDILARRPMWERFVDYRHGTGHGVGAMLNVHEKPQAFRYRISSTDPQPELKAGMITSDEPGIYLEGKYGIRIENLLLCVEKKTNEWGRFLGFETLTTIPYERDAIIPGMLTERQKEIINEYHGRIYRLYSERLDEEERKWLAEVTSKL